MAKTTSTVRTNRWLMILLAAIALALLWINHNNFVTIDVSANARHTLTDISIEAARALPGPVEIIAAIGPNKRQRDAITVLVNRYRKVKANLTLSWLNPETEPARARELQVAPGGELIMRHGTRETRLQNVSERTFTQALHKLSRTGDRSIAFVSGHGERDIEQQDGNGYAVIATSLERSGIKAQTLSLVSVPRVPETIHTLVIAAPSSPYFPGEVASVLDYINRGGNLLWLIEGGNLAGLDAVALEFGITVLDGIVLDAASRSWGADSPTFAVIDKYPPHPVNAGLTSPVLLPESRALNIAALAGQQTTALLQTGADSWTESGPVQGAVRFDENTTEQRGPLLLALAVERPRGKQTQRIAILGDADLFANTWIGNGANREFGERLLNWLAADDAQLNFVTIPPADTLDTLNRRQTLYIGAGFLLFLPSLFLLLGLWLWHRQKRN